MLFKFIAALVGTNLCELTPSILENLRQIINEDNQYAWKKQNEFYLGYTIGLAH